jgi:hypothetical protein
MLAPDKVVEISGADLFCQRLLWRMRWQDRSICGDVKVTSRETSAGGSSEVL